MREREGRQGAVDPPHEAGRLPVRKSETGSLASTSSSGVTDPKGIGQSAGQKKKTHDHENYHSRVG